VQFDVAGAGHRKLPLHGRDRHNPVVSVVKVAARFLRLNLACALHEHAGNDLKAVCDPVLDLLHQDGLFPDKVILQFRFGTRVRYVGDGQQQPDTRRVAVVENLRIDDQLSRSAVWPLEIDFVGLDPRASGRGRLQEGGELGHCPFAVSKRSERSAGDCRRIDFERPAERCARCYDLLVSGKEKQRLVR